MVVEICGGVWEERESSYLVLTMLLGIFDVITVLSRSQVETYEVNNIDLSILSAMVGNPSRVQYYEHRCPQDEGGY